MEKPNKKDQLTETHFGKTLMEHPHWANLPLRLTKEQKEDPLPVLHKFFQDFHLKDIRDMLGNWLWAVFTSPLGIYGALDDRDAHLLFYERIDTVLEAAYLLEKQMYKGGLRKEEKKSKRDRQSNKKPSLDKSSQSTINKLVTTNAENIKRFNGPNELLQCVEKDPLYVIVNVFKNEPLALLKVQLQGWQLIALSPSCQMYQDSMYRAKFLTFYDQLLELTEALFIINTQNIEKANLEKHIAKANQTPLLSQDQVSDPMQVVAGFFEMFSMTYIIQELRLWLEAGIFHAHNGRESQQSYIYLNVLCLVKAAHHLLNQ